MKITNLGVVGSDPVLVFHQHIVGAGLEGEHLLGLALDELGPLRQIWTEKYNIFIDKKNNEKKFSYDLLKLIHNNKIKVISNTLTKQQIEFLFFS